MQPRALVNTFTTAPLMNETNLNLPASKTPSPQGRQTPLAMMMAAALSLLTGCATTRPGPAQPLADTSAERDHTVQLQIFLDSQHFGPGVVDGKGGEFTTKALNFYRQAKGLRPEEQPDVSSIDPYTTYTIREDDLKVLGTMGSTPAEIAGQARQPYTSLKELLAERFHTTQAFVTRLNPGVNIDALTAGALVKVPNVGHPFHADTFPSDYPKHAVAAGLTRHVQVDIHTRMLQVLDGDQIAAAFPITPGSSDHPAPLGEWKVVGAVPWPWYRYDEGVLDHGERTATFFNLPPGVNNPVGILWTGLNHPGVGIHGTPNPETIGRAGSHGCIRLANWDAAAFYAYVQKGMQVTIQ